MTIESHTNRKLVDEFISIQILRITRKNSAVIEYLAHFQIRILLGQKQQMKILNFWDSRTQDFDSDRAEEDEDLKSKDKSNINLDHTKMHLKRVQAMPGLMVRILYYYDWSPVIYQSFFIFLFLDLLRFLGFIRKIF